MWHRFNPNPRGSSVGDCAVRAVAAATGQSWGGGMGGASPYMTSAVTQADLQRGFDNQSVMNKLNGLESGLCDGFYAMNTGMLQGFNGVQ